MIARILRRAILPAALLAATTLGGCYTYPYGYAPYGAYYGNYGYGYGYYPGYVGTGLVVGGWGWDIGRVGVMVMAAAGDVGVGDVAAGVAGGMAAGLATVLWVAMAALGLPVASITKGGGCFDDLGRVN